MLQSGDKNQQGVLNQHPEPFDGKTLPGSDSRKSRTIKGGQIHYEERAEEIDKKTGMHSVHELVSVNFGSIIGRKISIRSS